MRATDGVLYGVGVGYDFQAGNAVFGIEAEATDSTDDELHATGVVIAGDELLRARRGATSMSARRVGVRRRPQHACFTPRRGYTNARVNVAYE